MGVSVWARHLPPAPGKDPPWRGQPDTLAALTSLRRNLRSTIHDGDLPTGGDGGERLLLVFEELVSNALRHGRPPVDVTVTAAALGWLVVVRDAAGDRPPVPALDRDPAHGGMGLSLVGRLCRARGWFVHGDAKSVWARVPYLEPLAPDRLSDAAEHAVSLVIRLTETTAQTAANMTALAEQASSCGRSDLARQFQSLAARARLEAERARWRVLTRPPSGAGRAVS